MMIFIEVMFCIFVFFTLSIGLTFFLASEFFGYPKGDSYDEES